jgi:hypothetical protein
VSTFGDLAGDGEFVTVKRFEHEEPVPAAPSSISMSRALTSRTNSSTPEARVQSRLSTR